jgi:hypothetical protein
MVFQPIYTIGTKLSVEAADHIAVLVKGYRTNTVYNTQGGITDNEEVRSLEPLWTITPEYAEQLEIIAKRFRVQLSECIIVDTSFRVKRARGGPINFNGKSVVWYQTMEYQMGHMIGSWFDITLTNNAPDIHHSESPMLKEARTADFTHLKKELATAGRLVRRCAQCNKMDSEAASHKKCVGCKRVAYCDRACQKADWKRHKAHCIDLWQANESIDL